MRYNNKAIQTQDRARRAVAEFRKLQPTLTAYARNLTGKQAVRVEMSASDNGSTDGTKIYFKPPIRLGDMATARHEKSLCDKRDPDTLALYCQACSIREQILSTIYHEIAHIAFDSFAPTSMEDSKFTLKIVKSIAPEWYYERMTEKFVADPNILYGKKTYPELAQAVNPYFKLLVNAMEDVRINERMADARPGTRIMQDAQMLRIASEGVEQKDTATGKTISVYWNEYPTNHQACLAALMVASGYGDLIDDWFEERVVTAVRDAEMVTLLEEVPALTGPQQVFEHSFKVYMKFRDQGFFVTTDEEPPPAPEAEGDESDESETGSDGDDSPADGSGDSERKSDDAGQGDSGSEAPDSGGGAGRADGADESDGDRGGSEDHSGDESARSGSDSGDPTGLGSNDPGDSANDERGPGAGSMAPGAGQDDGEREPSSEGDRESDRLDQDPESSGDSAEDSDGLEQDSGAGHEDGSDDPESEAVGDSGDEGHGGGESEVHGESDADLRESESEEENTDSAEHGERESDGAPGSGDDLPGGECSGESSEELRPEDGDSEPRRATDVDALVGEDAGDTPLDYKPEAESAVDLTDHAPIEPVAPSIGSDERIELIDLGLHPEMDAAGDVTPEMEKAIDTAIIQSIYFEMPSQNITGLNIWKYDNWQDDALNRPWHAWGGERYSAMLASHRGQTIDPVGEAVLGPALMRMRVVFSDNQRTKRNRNMRSGRIDTRSLGKRGWSGDDRLFGRRVIPNKKDYFVALFLDVSGSTRGANIKMIKEAALAQAELCFRMGISFAVYAHTGSHKNMLDYSDGICVDLYEVKAPEQPWDNKSREALMALNPSAANLDGHTLEFARKLCDAQTQTNKVILYYSDGAMPLENHNEELEILHREISTCKAKGYTLLGVGVRTDSPARHGLETVQIDDSGEVAKVVTQLERHLVS